MNRLIIYATPFVQLHADSICVIENFNSVNVLDRPERLGPYRAVEEFLSWLYSRNELMVITQTSIIINFVGSMISDKMIDHEKVEIRLFMEDHSVLNFKFSAEGIIDGAWPFGIMDGYSDPDEVRNLIKHYQDIYSK